MILRYGFDRPEYCEAAAPQRPHTEQPAGGGGRLVGFGLAATMPGKNKTETVDYNNDHSGTATTNTEGKKDNVSKFQVGPNVVGQLRMGWLF